MRFIFLLLLMIPALFSNGQQITGSTKDENGAPLGGTTVSLVRTNDSAIAKLAVAGSDGVYRFTGIPEGNYKVMASFVGYKNAVSSVFSVGPSEFNVTELKLVKISGSMGNVTVTASKPMIEVKADKMILNVEGTINAVGSNALELLRKSPGVLVDKDDNISLSGKNGVQVLIDGKPNPLSGQELGNYLKTLQSSQVEAIELITNPSAKYDAAGNAGIINIRLKKNKSLGTNGSVNAGMNMAINTKYNAGASLNYRNKNINIFSTYNYSYTPNEQHLHIERSVLDSLFDQVGTIFDTRRTHNFKAGADFFLNKKNTLGVMVNGILADPASESNNRTAISNTTTKLIDRILVASNNTQMNRRNINVNLNYYYIDPKGTSFTANADRGSYKLETDQLQSNLYYDPSGQVHQGSVIYHMLSPASIHINSFKGDYEQNFMKGKLSVGAKTAWVRTDNDFQRFNVSGSMEELDKDRSNHFLYKENIHAGYINYSRQYKKFMIQGGIRIENTRSEGVSNGLKNSGSGFIPSISSFKRHYTDFFPSGAITFNKNPLKQWGFTFSRRIDRPAYQDLNPFEFKLDEYTFMKGNINLRPQYTNSVGVTHTYKYKLNMSLNYSHVKDIFTQLIDTAERSKAFISKKNLATQDIISFNVSYPFQYKSYSLFTNISSNYSSFKADFGTGRELDLQALGFNLFVQNSLKFAKTWTAELGGFYNAPTVYFGSFKGKSMFNVDAGISKQCLEGRMTVKASVSDIFYSMKFRGTTAFAGQETKFSFRQESRQFKLSVNLRFGNNGVKPARQRTTGAEDETKRVQQGGGIIGN